MRLFKLGCISLSYKGEDRNIIVVIIQKKVENSCWSYDILGHFLYVCLMRFLYHYPNNVATKNSYSIAILFLNVSIMA